MSIDNDWVTVDGVRYVPEAPLKAEIVRLQDECRERARNEHRLRAALDEIQLCINPLLPDGWSDALHVSNVIASALATEGK